MTADSATTRLAWFSPVPPTRSGISAYTTDLLPHLGREYDVEVFDAACAHEFAWRARRQPFDLPVYQLGNAPCHDFMWGYLATYPGLVVLHDARLHHARARQLLAAKRDEDYRREFRFDHPDVRPDAAEYAIAAMGGAIQYLWPMRRVVLHAARRVAVHGALVAEQLRREVPTAAVDVIRMGVPRVDPSSDARARVRAAFGIPDRAVLFTAFGKMTPEKRIGPIVQALAALQAQGLDVRLLLVGDDGARFAGADRVYATGYVDEPDVSAHLLAGDVCLCLRWPTALETSASWLRCLAAALPTIVTDLAHTADVPPHVACRVDLLEEDRSLFAAMRDLAVRADRRAAFARAGHDWWAAHHTVDMMADDYRRVIAAAIATPPFARRDLPLHFLEDHGGRARAIASRYGVSVDVLGSQS